MTTIVQDPAVCGGQPTVRGTRILVSVLIAMRNAGETDDFIVSQFPALTAELLRAVWSELATGAAGAAGGDDAEPHP